MVRFLTHFLASLWSSRGQRPGVVARKPLYRRHSGGFAAICEHLPTRDELDDHAFDLDRGTARSSPKSRIDALTIDADGIILVRCAFVDHANWLEHSRKDKGDRVRKNLLDALVKGELPSSLSGTQVVWNTCTYAQETDALRERGQLHGPERRPVTSFDEAFAYLQERHADPSSLIHLLSTFDTPPELGMLDDTLASHPDPNWAKRVIRHNPWLGPHLAWILPYATPEDISGEDRITPAALTRMLNRATSEATDINEVLIRRCMAYCSTSGSYAPAFSELSLLSKLPMSWLQETEDYLRVIRIVSPSLHMLCRSDTARAAELIRDCRGRFLEYFTSLPGVRTIEDVPGLIVGCENMVHSVDMHLIAPIALEGDGNGPRFGYTGSYAVALDVVIGSGGLRRLLRMSADWHERGPTHQNLGSRTPWDRSVQDFKKDSLKVVELLSDADLETESNRLSHCVGYGTYAEKARAGASRIFSIRQGNKSLSTMEIEFIGVHPKLLQHRGLSNAEPDELCKEVEKAWFDAVHHGRLKVTPPAKLPYQRVEGLLREGFGPAAWRGYIRKEFADMSWDDFVRQINWKLDQMRANSSYPASTSQ